MKLTPVTTLDEAETVRLLRNTGREWLFDQKYVSAPDQVRWWQAEPRRVWLARGVGGGFMGGNVVGFMALSERDGLTFVTLVVAPQHRGVGYGTEIYRQAPRLAGGTVHAAIWNRNAASIRAATSAGYRPMEAPSALISVFRGEA